MAGYAYPYAPWDPRAAVAVQTGETATERTAPPPKKRKLLPKTPMPAVDAFAEIVEHAAQLGPFVPHTRASKDAVGSGVFQATGDPVEVVQYEALMGSDEAVTPYVTIELQPTKKADTSPIHNENIKWLAFELSVPTGDAPATFLMCERSKLKEFVLQKLPANNHTVTKKLEAVYHIYREGRRNRLRTVVPVQDLVVSNAESFFVIRASP